MDAQVAVGFACATRGLEDGLLPVVHKRNRRLTRFGGKVHIAVAVDAELHGSEDLQGTVLRLDIAGNLDLALVGKGNRDNLVLTNGVLDIRVLQRLA